MEFKLLQGTLHAKFYRFSSAFDIIERPAQPTHGISKVSVKF
jgi:hypothetical protein